MKPKIAILTVAHRGDDVRLFHKVGKSLSTIADVRIFASTGIDDGNTNPAIEIIGIEGKRQFLAEALLRLRRYRPQILICVEPITILVGMKLKKETGCLLVQDVHEFFASAAGDGTPFPINKLKRWAYSRIENYLLRKLDLAICVNEILADRLQPYVPEVVVCQNYPVPKCFDTTVQKEYDIIYSGRINHDRGIFILLNAVKILTRKFPNITLALLGRTDSPKVTNELLQTIQNMQLAKNVFYAGEVPHDQVSRYILKSKVGVNVLNPAIKRYRTALPLKVLEFLQHGVPVVVNDFPYLHQCLNQTNACRFCSYKASELAAQISKILSLPEEDYSELSISGKRLIEQELCWSIEEKKLIKGIQNLLCNYHQIARKMLLFAYFFPPLGGPGVQRPCKLTKYLREFGWHTDVISVRNIVFHSRDNTLIKESGADHIVRTRSYDPMSLFYQLKKRLGKVEQPKKDSLYFQTPERWKALLRNSFLIDDKIGWVPFATRAGLRLGKHRHYQAVMVTMGPFSAGIAAYRVAKRFKLPLVLDYRDSWGQQVYLTPFHRIHAKYWERKLLHECAGFVTVGEVGRDDLCMEYGNWLRKKSHVMYNGWDESDFTGMNRKREPGAIRLSFVGNIYRKTKADYFIQACLSLIKKHQFPEDLEIRFIGNYYRETGKLLSSPPLKPYMTVKSQMSHQEAIQEMMDSDILLLLASSEDWKGVITGKLFEYFRAEKHILGLVPSFGEAARLMKLFGHTNICDMADVPAIERAILEAYSRVKSGEIVPAPPVEYSREEQTKQFTLFLEKLI